MENLQLALMGLTLVLAEQEQLGNSCTQRHDSLKSHVLLSHTLRAALLPGQSIEQWVRRQGCPHFPTCLRAPSSAQIVGGRSAKGKTSVEIL